jgi:hypothetical protein
MGDSFQLKRAVAGALILSAASLAGCASHRADGLSPLIEAAVARAGDNASEIERALAEAPADERPGMRFLVAYMPQRDLETLSADYLLTNVRLAYQARREAPWGEQLPDEVFFNDVLPYASIDERRDDWRAGFYQQFKPLVADARSPGEAAVILNREDLRPGRREVLAQAPQGQPERAGVDRGGHRIVHGAVDSPDRRLPVGRRAGPAGGHPAVAGSQRQPFMGRKSGMATGTSPAPPNPAATSSTAAGSPSGPPPPAAGSPAARDLCDELQADRHDVPDGLVTA